MEIKHLMNLRVKKTQLTIELSGFYPPIEGAADVFVEEGGIIIRQSESACAICGNIANEFLFGKGVCRLCLKLISSSV